MSKCINTIEFSLNNDTSGCHMPTFISANNLPSFLINHYELNIDLNNESATSILSGRKNPDVKNHPQNLNLSCENMEIESVTLNGALLARDQYNLDQKTLTIKNITDIFKIEINHINIQANHASKGAVRMMS